VDGWRTKRVLEGFGVGRTSTKDGHGEVCSQVGRGERPARTGRYGCRSGDSNDSDLNGRVPSSM